MTLAASVLYLGFCKSQLISVVNIFGLLSMEPADLQVQRRLVPVRRVHARLDGAVGPALLRPDLRVRRADAADGPRGPGQAARVEVPPRIEDRACVA